LEKKSQKELFGNEERRKEKKTVQAGQAGQREMHLFTFDSSLHGIAVSCIQQFHVSTFPYEFLDSEINGW